MSNKITRQTIKMRHIKDFLRSEKNLRDKIQILIEASVGHAEDHSNDFTLVSALINGLKENKTRNLKAITAYIQEHVQGIHWTKLGDGSMGYKGKKGEKVVFKTFEYPWYNHKLNMASQQIQVDALSRAKSLMTTLATALEKGTIKKGQEEQAQTIIDTLKGNLTA